MMRVVRSPDDRTANPFVPGFNQVPDELAGRDEIYAAMGEAFEQAAFDGRTPRPILLSGSRGVGKTVLLTEAQRVAAQELGWLSIHHECVLNRSLLTAVVTALAEVKRLYEQQPESRRPAMIITGASLSAGAFGVHGGIQVTRAAEREDQSSIDTMIDSAMDSAVAMGAGLLITVDELQLSNRSELNELAASLQVRVPRGMPIVLLAAGLPSIQDPKRIPTYFERGEWHELGPLDHSAAVTALAAPAMRAGRPMTPDAARALATASAGYPYAIQLMGQYAWRVSHGSNTVTLDHAQRAIPQAEDELGRGMFRTRWESLAQTIGRRLTSVAPALSLQQEYVKVIAEHPDGTMRASDVARELKREPRELSYLPKRLEQHGIIYRAADDSLHFALPGFQSWIVQRTRQEPPPG